MLFNSIDFLLFFPLVVCVFFLIPKKLRCVWLLVSSYYFYMSWNPKYALLIALSTVITYLSGLFIDKCSSNTYKKFIVAGSLISNLLILGIFKYANFAIYTLSAVLQRAGFAPIDKRLDLLLPVGISFYTFQALSYTLDVYKGRIKAEKNLIRYALFVSFFPQLVAGPIERSGHLLRQIQNIDKLRLWNYQRVRDGVLLMFWGLFQKLVIADRASLLVNEVYDHYQSYGFLEISIATFLFAFQIYCDFAGYTNIARGASNVMGFELMQNFRQPYFAISIKDFWRRWHISLTSWFTDYLYIPLGGNRKGDVRKYINIFIVFIVSGLWHGASWNFIVWGFVHAVYQVAGDIKDKLTDKVKVLKNSNNSLRLNDKNSLLFSDRLLRIIITFILVDIAWVFFASSSLRQALDMLIQMFTSFQMASIYEIGLDRGNWFMFWFGVGILTVVDVCHEMGKSIFAMVNKQLLYFRWLLYLGLIWSVIMFGIYGSKYDTSQFIYFQF
ncbi:MAG: MBOAT family protein [Lachnospiraceae bacterium]|nr:MBOAT family protein [Lachnospiraceae bacterium]